MCCKKKQFSTCSTWRVSNKNVQLITHTPQLLQSKQKKLEKKLNPIWCLHCVFGKAGKNAKIKIKTMPKIFIIHVQFCAVLCVYLFLCFMTRATNQPTVCKTWNMLDICIADTFLHQTFKYLFANINRLCHVLIVFTYFTK